MTEHLTNVSDGGKAVFTHSVKVQSIIERAGAALSPAAGRGGYLLTSEQLWLELGPGYNSESLPTPSHPLSPTRHHKASQCLKTALPAWNQVSKHVFTWDTSHLNYKREQ